MTTHRCRVPAAALLILAVAGCSPAPDPAPTPPLPPAPVTARPAPDPDSGAEAFSDLSEISCAPTRGSWSMRAVVTNSSDEQVGYVITPTVSTDDGTSVASSTTTSLVGPRASARIDVTGFARTPPGARDSDLECTIRAVKQV